MNQARTAPNLGRRVALLQMQIAHEAVHSRVATELQAVDRDKLFEACFGGTLCVTSPHFWARLSISWVVAYRGELLLETVSGI